MGMKFKVVEGMTKSQKDELEVLTESTLNRIVNGHDEDGYVIISASRGDCLGDDANAQQIEDENNKRYKELRHTIKSLGYSFVPVFGGYKELNSDRATVEKSLIVFPYHMYTGEKTDFADFVNSLATVGKTYNQDSILVKPPKGKPAYLNLKSGLGTYEEGEYDTPFNGVTLNDVQKEYFTSLKRWNDTSKNRSGKETWDGLPQRFTYEESYLRKAPQSVMSRHSRYHEGELC